jgi:hypothetical protein
MEDTLSVLVKFLEFVKEEIQGVLAFLSSVSSVPLW